MMMVATSPWLTVALLTALTGLLVALPLVFLMDTAGMSIDVTLGWTSALAAVGVSAVVWRQVLRAGVHQPSAGWITALAAGLVVPTVMTAVRFVRVRRRGAGLR